MPGTKIISINCATHNDSISTCLTGAAELVFDKSVTETEEEDGSSVIYNFEFLEDFQDLHRRTGREHNGRMPRGEQYGSEESKPVLKCTKLSESQQSLCKDSANIPTVLEPF